MSNDLVIVDLSHHNTVKSFLDLKNGGVMGVIHKATEGTSFTDSKYLSRREECKEVGLLWCSYHFLRHGNVEDQIDYWLSVTTPTAGERLCIDFEHEDVTLNDLHEAVIYLESKNKNYQITVYSGHTIKEALGDRHDSVLAKTSLWIAQYREGNPSWPVDTWPAWSLHQYSDGDVGGSPRDVPGIKAPCDCNRFNGSRENCAKWMGPANGKPAPTTVSRVDVTGDVDVYVDGKLVFKHT